MSSLGIVVIGRNEGERLRRCLDSLAGYGSATVYVDSGSTDGSVTMARGMGVNVVELDLGKPFTAARGRNAGLERLLELSPEIDFVQFVDGDCELAPQWLEVAAEHLRQHTQVVAVAGRLRERFPEASVYNRLCELEWDQPAGEALACGGVAMYRAACLRDVGGFDPSVPAGEEPELCLRLRRRGWKIMRLPDEMGWHDAAMARLGQWWRRAVRNGYGGLDVAQRFERGDGIFSGQIRSSRLWGIAYPVGGVTAALVAGALGGPWAATTAATLALLVLPAQIARLALRGRRRGLPWRAAAAYGALLMLGKWASLVGQMRHWRDGRLGRQGQLIEHKEMVTVAASAAAGAEHRL